MKKIFMISFFCSCWIMGLAQNGNRGIYNLVKDTTVFSTRLGSQDQVLRFFTDDKKVPINPKKRLLVKDTIYLSQSDLKLELDLSEHNKAFLWDFDLGMIDSQGDTIFPSLNNISADLKNLIFAEDRQKLILWEDALENHLDYDANYQLFLISTLKGNANCEEVRPVFFKSNSEWPHYLGATLGITSLIAAEFLKSDARDLFEKYDQLWQNDAPFTQANSLYLDARKTRNQSRNLRIVGISALSIEAILLLRRYLRVSNRQDTYDTYCTEKLASKHWQIEPGLVQSYHQNGQRLLTASLSLTYNF